MSYLLARERIRELVARYAIALDARDVPTMVELFVPDVRVHGGGSGRDELARFFDSVLSPPRVTFHFLGNHLIIFDDVPGLARGQVYCRAEHEVRDEWIVMALMYQDRYAQHEGEWLFRSRRTKVFYSADITSRPHQVPGRFHFPGNAFVHQSELPEEWPTWNEFWARVQGNRDER